MVATLIRLRFRLLANTLTREVWRLVFTILGLLYALGIIATLAIGAFFLGASGVDLAAPFVAAGVVLTLLWILVPLLAFGMDDTLDPARFAMFATPTPALGAGLILAGGITIPGLLTLGALLAMTLAWITTPLVALTWILAAIIGFATCLTLARLCTTAAATQLRSRRGKDAAAGIGMILLLAAIVLPNFAEGLDLEGIWHAVLPALGVLAWTPLGAPWAIPGAFAAGNVGTGVALLAVSLAWLGVLLYLWVRLLTPAMTMPGEASASARKGRGTFDLLRRLHAALRLPMPAAAVAARCLRYWRSDPRYFTQAITIIVIAPVLGVAFAFAPTFPDELILALPLFMAFFAGWAIHNDTAYDSTALWLGISSGVSGRDDRLGRAVAFLLWSVPAVVVMTALIIAFTHRWDMAAPVFAVVLGIFGGGVGFSLALSGLVVYPVQPPGTSPFSTTGMGAFGFTMLIQAVAAVGTVVLAVPTIVTAVLAVVVSPVWGYLSLVIAVVTMIGAVWAGIAQGGRFLEARGPAHLLAIKGWTGH